MESLVEYLSRMSQDDQREWAKSVGTSVGYLRKAIHHWRTGKPLRFSPELAVAIEQRTKGEVPRRHMRPNDWHLVWPELIPDPPPKGKPVKPAPIAEVIAEKVAREGIPGRSA